MDAGLWLDYRQRLPVARRLSSTRLNSANTAADSPDTREREIVGGTRRSMNRSDFHIYTWKFVPAAAGGSSASEVWTRL